MYPIFKKNSHFNEFDVILDEGTLFSVRNGDVLAFGMVENPWAVQNTMEFEDSSQEEFEQQLSAAMDRLRSLFKTKKYGALLLPDVLDSVSAEYQF